MAHFNRDTRPHRHLRFKCSLGHGEHRVDALAVDYRGEELYVRVAVAGFAVPADRSALTITVQLPGDPTPLEHRAEVVWTNLEPRTGNVGVMLRMTDPVPGVSAQLNELAWSFRDTVLLVGPDAIRCGASLLDDYWVLTADAVDEAIGLLRQEQIAVLVSGSVPLAAILERTAPRLGTTSALAIAIADDAGSSLPQVFATIRPSADTLEVVALIHLAVDRHGLVAENDRLEAELAHARQRLERENAYLKHRLVTLQGFEGMIGGSANLRRALDELARVRSTDVTVHIHGETGTGKEIVARALHFGGPRRSKVFVAQNCGGVSDSLLQSTLFGYTKGAFTGADRDRPGMFQEADGGTLFLDEVAELSPAVQAALLRAIEVGEIVPVGATKPIKVDVRVISATHKDLREQVQVGAFREDLFYRLVVLSVRLPPLRERVGDIPMLCRHFLDLFTERYGKHISSIALDTIEILEAYPWPGNVRELENEIERLVVLSEDGRELRPELLSPHLRAATRNTQAEHDKGTFVPHDLGYDGALDALSRALVQRALDRCEGRLEAAAELLKIERSRLGKLRRRLGLP